MEEILNVKIYALYTDEQGIRYIGLTIRTIEERFRQHICDAKRIDKNTSKYKCNKYKDKWVRKNISSIKVVSIEENIDNLKLAMERERYWIKYYKENGCKLVNSTEGGEGTLGFSVPSEKNPKAKLKETEVIEIRKLAESKELTRKEIADRFNVNIHSIIDIIRGLTWKKTEGFINPSRIVQTGENHSQAKLTEEIVIEIRKLAETKEYTQREIAKKFNIHYKNINKIITRTTWKHI
jgi:predicted XRE-type DNA-binding protein